MRPVLIVPPAELPITLSQFKEHDRLETSDDDVHVSSLIDAAVAHLDGHNGILGRCMVNQTWDQVFTDWAEVLNLPFPDVSAVVIKYYDTAGDSQTVSASLYDTTEVAGHANVVFKPAFTYPSTSSDFPNPITVTLTAGFGGAVDVPAALKVAIMQLVAHWNNNREAVGSGTVIPLSFNSLIAPYRMISL